MPALIRTVLLTLVIALILALTLAPVAAEGGISLDIVGFRGVADAIANVLLFVPFGLAASLRFPGWRRPILGALALSAGIEVLQLVTPGRYSSPSDIVFNTLGAAAGALLVRRSDAWLRPPANLRRVFVAGSLAVALTTLAGGAWLFGKDVPRDMLHGQWTAVFADMEAYRGRVVAAFVGALPVPSWGIRASAELRQRLLAGDTVRVDFSAGPPPRELAPIFSIFDQRERLILLVGADGADAVIRFRQRATALGLDDREIRVAGAFAGIRAGDRLTFKLWDEDAGYCLQTNDRRWCHLGFTLGDTWGLLHYPLPGVLPLFMPFLWIGALTAPVGFWIRAPRGLALASMVLVVGCALAPRSARVLPTPASQYGAALAGLAAGYALGAVMRRPAQAAPAPGRPGTGRSARRPPRIPLPSD